jgi:hypothetical protein
MLKYRVLEWIEKEATVACFKILSSYVSEINEKVPVYMNLKWIYALTCIRRGKVKKG